MKSRICRMGMAPVVSMLIALIVVSVLGSIAYIYVMRTLAYPFTHSMPALRVEARNYVSPYVRFYIRNIGFGVAHVDRIYIDYAGLFLSYDYALPKTIEVNRIKVVELLMPSTYFKKPCKTPPEWTKMTVTISSREGVYASTIVAINNLCCKSDGKKILIESWNAPSTLEGILLFTISDHPCCPHHFRFRDGRTISLSEGSKIAMSFEINPYELSEPLTLIITHSGVIKINNFPVTNLIVDGVEYGSVIIDELHGVKAGLAISIIKSTFKTTEASDLTIHIENVMIKEVGEGHVVVVEGMFAALCRGLKIEIKYPSGKIHYRILGSAVNINVDGVEL